MTKLPRINRSTIIDIRQKIKAKYEVLLDDLKQKIAAPDIINAQVALLLPPEEIKAAILIKHHHKLFIGPEYFYLTHVDKISGERNIQFTTDVAAYDAELLLRLNRDLRSIKFTEQHPKFAELKIIFDQHQQLTDELNSIIKELSNIPTGIGIDKVIAAWPQIVDYIPEDVLADYRKYMVNKEANKLNPVPKVPKAKKAPVTISTEMQVALTTIGYLA